MGLTDIVREGRRRVAGFLSPETSSALREAEEVSDRMALKAAQLQESLVDIELAMEDMGWRESGAVGEVVWNFKRESLKKIIDLSRRMYLMNPLYRRSVELEALYVWGLGFGMKARDANVQKVLDDFYKNPKNKVALTSIQKWADMGREVQITGNVFLALFRNPDTGACRVRLIPVDQISQIITNPEDSQETLYYKRVVINSKGQSTAVLYPDISQDLDNIPASYTTEDGSVLIEQDVCVLGVITGGVLGMKFGCPEYMSIMSWVTAYKVMLENWATIIKAYARMAMKITGLPGKKGVAATKAKMGTGVSSSSARDSNPPTNVASWFAASGGADISAIRTAGATTSASEGKPLRDMAAAGAGIPSHFYGDSDMGNFATSETLDRPTELRFVSRQRMYISVMERINGKLIEWSARAPSGVLKQAGASVAEVEDPFDESISYKVSLPSDGDLFIEISFPSILERNVTERVRAVVAAATLNGSKAEGIIPNRKFLFKLLLEAMGVQDADKIASEQYPTDVVQGFVDPREELKVEQDKVKVAQDAADAQAKIAAKPTPKGSGVGPVSNNK